MGTRRKISDQTKQAIVSAYGAGWPIPEIVDRWKISANYIATLASKAGVRRPRPNDPQPSPPVAPQPLVALGRATDIFAMADRGMGETQIAAALRCPYREVRAVLDSRKP